MPGSTYAIEATNAGPSMYSVARTFPRVSRRASALASSASLTGRVWPAPSRAGTGRRGGGVTAAPAGCRFRCGSRHLHGLWHALKIMACLDFSSASRDCGPATNRRSRPLVGRSRGRTRHRDPGHKRRPPNLARRGLLRHPAHQRRRQHRLRNRCSGTTLTGSRPKAREAQRDHTTKPAPAWPSPAGRASNDASRVTEINQLSPSPQKRPDNAERSDNRARTAPFTTQGHTQTAGTPSSPGFVRPHCLPRPAWRRPRWPPGRA